MSWDLETLTRAQLIGSLDRHLALRLAPEGGPVQTAVALLSRALSQGHVGQKLESLRRREWLGPEGPVALEPPSAEALETALGQSPLVGQPGQYRPLILDRGTLYFHKYHQYQCRLADNLKARLANGPTERTPQLEGAWRARFTGYRQMNQGQPLAGLLAGLQPLLLLTGGPGTGKTTTAFKIMAMLQQAQAESGKEPLNIRLAAPTGKAAARLGQSIAAQAAQLEAPWAANLPQRAETIHRLLGHRPFEPGRFLHHAGYPLEVDLLILDEASMVDLPLFVKLLEAVPLEAKVVLMGDPDQLASVESGAVLADLAQDQDPRGLRRTFHRLLGPLAPDQAPVPAGPALLDHRLRLSHSHRFDANRGIGRLAEAVRLGRAPMAQWLDSEETDRTEHAQDLAAQIRALLQRELAPLFAAETPEAALAAQGRFGLLCALRRGRFGVEGVNAWAEEDFGQNRPFYPHRPVMVTQNAPHLGLANGDLGVCLEAGAGGLEVWFDGPEGPRSFPPALLPAHVSAYGLTVHKSQGSEFERVALLLPPEFTEPLSRELVYTALTRAKRHFSLIGPVEVFEQAALRSERRDSGLKRELWGEGEP